MDYALGSIPTQLYINFLREVGSTKQLRDSNSISLVASNGQPVGFIAAREAQHGWSVHAFYVDGEHRRGSIGTELLDRLVKEAMTQGVRCVYGRSLTPGARKVFNELAKRHESNPRLEFRIKNTDKRTRGYIHIK